MTTKRDELYFKVISMLEFRFGDGTGEDPRTKITAKDIMAAIDSYVAEEKEKILKDVVCVRSFVSGSVEKQKILNYIDRYLLDVDLDPANLKVPSPYSRDNDGTEESTQY